MYWELRTESPDKASIALIGKEPDLDSILYDFMWNQGEILTQKLPTPLEFCLDSEGGSFIPAYFEPMIPLMSDSMIHCLNRANVKNIQAYDAIVYDFDGKALDEKFFAVNITDCIQCVDLEKSVYKTIQDSKRLRFKKIIVNENMIHDVLVFRLREKPSTVIVENSVKEILDKEKLPGLVFINASC